MASIFESWKKNYSTDEYEFKVKEYKDKLREFAKLNTKFGGRHEFTLICTKCNESYISYAHNQIICNSCKSNGYQEECKHCNKKFIYKNGSKCCDNCKKEQPWKRNKIYSDEQRAKFRKSKMAWYQSEDGFIHKQKMSKLNAEKMKKYNSDPNTLNDRRIRHKKISDTLKRKIANGEVVPKITNSRTHWDAKIVLDNGQIKKFRSSWEAVFWNSNQHLEFETLRIPWTDSNGELHSYIPDFYDRNKNIIYEIKPRSTWDVQNNKMQQSIKWCMEQNIKFIWINENNIINYINESDFTDTENLKQLHKVKNGIKKNKD